MTSSSTDPAVFRGLEAEAVHTPSLGTDLRSGAWTRLGDGAVLGDPVTESVLQGLAETARAAARAQGYAVGWAEGRTAADERARTEAQRAARERETERARQAEEHEQAVTALHRAAQRLEQTVVEVCAAVESHSVDVALQLTEAVLGREVALATDPGLDAVRRALSLLPTGTLATVRLHPRDRAALDSTALDAPGITIVDDPSLRRGDAVAETDDRIVDATVAAALTRVREVLAP